MVGAFQSNAFQDNAFQIDAAVADTGTVLTRGKTEYSGASFSRKRFEKIRAAQLAETELRRKAAALKARQAKEEKAALWAALSAAAEAIRIINEAQIARESAEEYANLTRMTLALDGARGAHSVAEIIRQARLAEIHADAIIAQRKEEQDEEDLILLFLQ